MAIGAGLSGTDLALHPDFERNRVVYISYTKPLDPPAGAAASRPRAAGAAGGRGAATDNDGVARDWDGKVHRHEGHLRR